MDEFRIVAISRTLFVQGRLRRKSVGRVSGLVLAIGWAPATASSPRRAGARVAAPELHYLVSDLTRPAPVWVSAAEVTKQQWFVPKQS